MYRKIRGMNTEFFTRFLWAVDGPGSISCKYGMLLLNNRINDKGRSVNGAWEFRHTYSPTAWASFCDKHGHAVPMNTNLQTVLRSAEKLMSKYRRHRVYKKVFVVVVVICVMSTLGYWGYTTGNFEMPEFVQKLLSLGS
jgi:hypothetical protein